MHKQPSCQTPRRLSAFTSAVANEMSEASNGKPPNGVNSVLSTLAKSSDRLVQLGTLGLIALSGVGNWMATWKSSDNNRQEIVQGQEKIREEVIRQVRDIHDWIANSTDEFHKGNEDSAVTRKLLNQLMQEDLQAFERRQITSLSNQKQILENDSVMIRDIHEIVEDFEKWKKAEQMRGAPP